MGVIANHCLDERDILSGSLSRCCVSNLIDDDAPHDRGGQPEKLATILRRQATSGKQLQERFADECRRTHARAVAGATARHSL